MDSPFKELGGDGDGYGKFGRGKEIGERNKAGSAGSHYIYIYICLKEILGWRFSDG